MSILPASVDYSDRDFESLRARLIDLIGSVFPTWTNVSKTNFANILMESFCFIGDVLAFYQDQQAREGRFAFTEMRKNMIALSKLIRYSLGGAAAATCDVTLTITNPGSLIGSVTPSTSPVVVKTGSLTSPISGELQGTVSFASGETSKVFTWRHSITQTPYVVASTGKSDQRVLMPYGPFLEDTDIVTTPTQGTWTKVDTFFNSGPNDTHYRIDVDQNDRAEFVFGDGTNGAIPVGNITFNYQVGGGVDGNVEAGSLKKIETTFYDSEGNQAFVTAENVYDAEGGIPREEVEAARVNAPESLRVLNRTVCREDYEINAKRVSGVGRALMLSSNEETSISENRGMLFIIPTTGGTPSQSMLDDVETMVTETYPKTITFQLDVMAASYKTIDVYVVVYLARNVQSSTAKAEIEAALEDFFEPMLADGTANQNVDFGYNYKDVDGNPAGEVAWSDILNVIRDLSSIRKVDAGNNGLLLNSLRDDVQIPNWQFPALGNVTVIDGDSGAEI